MGEARAALPLLAEIGVVDSCFPIDHAMEHHRRLERIYKVAGAELELDLFQGGHKCVVFFRRHLAATW